MNNNYSLDFDGIYPPIPTPFDISGKFCPGALKDNLFVWVEHPLRGVIAPGSNGEAAFLTYEEKLLVWEICAEVLEPAGKLLIAGIGVETTAETIRLSREAGARGAQALLVQPPYFFKPQMSHDVLVTHFLAVADASPVGVILYNVPQFTGVDFPLETILALSEHPQIIGIKDSSINLVKMTQVMALAPEFKVYCGTGSALLGYLAIGSAGGIMALANIAPVRLNRIITCFYAGEIDEARRLQFSLAALNTAVTQTYGVPGLKYAMDQLGLYGGNCRRPLLPLEKTAKDHLDRLIADADLPNFSCTG